jgi:molecular chaperone GrpE (heat shock protein)
MIQLLVIGVVILVAAFALPHFGIDLLGLLRERLGGRGAAARAFPEQLCDLLRDSNQRICGLEKAIEQLEAVAADSQSCRESAPPHASPELEEIRRRLEALADHIGAIRELAEARGEEVERLREGRDFAATRAFARGVIKTIDLLQDFQSQLSESHSEGESALLGDALRRLEAAESQLTFLLEANRIEPFSPEPGESVLDGSRRFKPVERCPAGAGAEVGSVKSVRYPGYVLVQGESKAVVIREAHVTVFGPALAPEQQEQEGTPPNE